MEIHGLTVCVNYSDFLSISIERWKEGLTSLTVVTDSEDEATHQLAERAGVNLFITNAFYEDGAKFNKGKALEQARKFLPWEDWFLFFDADIVPMHRWLSGLRILELKPGALYGARRFQHTGAGPMPILRIDPAMFPLINDAPCDGGYFHLFHTSDPVVQVEPGADLLETCWSHAGVYDSKFKMRWPKDKWIGHVTNVLHLGERENWTGRGDREGMTELMKKRMQHPIGGWDAVNDLERIKRP